MPAFRSLPARCLCVLLALAGLAPALHAQRQPEKLGRGVIALRGVDAGGNGTNNWTGSGASQVYIGWRLFATDPESVAFNVYRSAAGGAAVKLNATPLTASTNYVDTTASLTVANAYHVTPVVNGVEGPSSEAWTLPANSAAQPCFTIPMPALPDGDHYVHLAWPGDLDGDGYMDLVVDRLPDGTSGTIRVEAYSTRTLARLWSVDCGPAGAGLISAGQNDGVTVFDFDGDGKCEVITKSVAGTVFGNGTVASGTGVYLSVLEGSTGREISRLQVAGAIAASTDAKNIGVAFLDGVHPSLVVMDEAHDFNAYDVNPTTKALTLRWKFNSPSSPYPHGHGFRVDDPDGDGRDEISDVAMCVDDNGTLVFQNELNHGDRYHISDIDPDRPGLECFAVQQDNPTQLSYVLYDAATGRMLWRKYASGMVDNGRGNVGSIDSRFASMQSWSASGGTLVDAQGNPVSNTQPVCNFSLWWDADPLREILNRQIVDKWNSSGTSGGTSRLLTGYNFQGATYSWRDAVPLCGDILGDWREEIVTEDGAGSKLVIFSTTKTAASRYPTFLQDPQYRCDLTLKGYMQSHHPGYYFGQGMPRPPRAPVWNGDLTWVGGAAGNTWDAGLTASWKTSATGAPTTFSDGRSVLFDLTGASDNPILLSGALAPSQVVVHAPKGKTYTLGGAGTLGGAMTFTKGGPGALVLGGTHTFTGATVVSEGALLLDGALTDSAVRVDSRGVFGGTGTVSHAVAFPEARAVLAPGGLGAAGTLTLAGGLSQAGGVVNDFDLSASPAGASDRVAVTGNLTLSGANIIRLNLLDGTLAPGATYTLFTYTGSFTGSLASLVVRGAEAWPCTLANTGTAITLTDGTLRAAATATWNGGSSGAWTLATGSGWSSGGSAASFATGDQARFEGAGSSVTLNSLVLPGSTVIDSATSYTVSGTGAIGGTGGLAKSGAGTLTLGTANTYTGPTTITGGVIAVPWLADGGLPSPLGASDSAASNLMLDGGTLRLTGGSTSTLRGITLGAAGGAFDLPSSGSLLNLSGTLTGPGGLLKTGPGLLLLNAVNSYSGGTVIKAGRVLLTASREDNSPTSPIQYGLGSGSVTLDGGTLTLGDTSVGDFDYVDSRAFWPLVVPAGSTGRLDANGRMVLGGALTGSGELTFFTPYVRTDITGNWSAFAGRINVVTDGDGGDFRLANSAGLPDAWLDLAAGVYCYSRAGSGTTTLALGALSGAAGSVLNAGTGSGAGANQPALWKIGRRNLDTTFSGVISGTSRVTKEGSGSLTLAGANTYTGATTVSSGTLLVTGSLGATAVTVSAGATVGGTGSLGGDLTLASGARLAFGVTPSGVAGLTVSGATTLGGAVTVTAVNLGGTLQPGTYTLLTYAGSLASTPSFTWAAPAGSPALAATFSTTTAGQIKLTLTALDPLEQWRKTWFGSPGSTGDAADLADPDADGLANFAEYALGSDPLAASPNAVPLLSSAGGRLRLAFNRIADPALVYAVEATDEFADWAGIWTSTGAENTDGPVTVTDSETLAAHPRRFLRLHITR